MGRFEEIPDEQEAAPAAGSRYQEVPDDTPLDPRGRPYDPRFAPEPEEKTPGRPIKNTGAYEDLFVPATGTPDKVAPYGLSGVVEGAGGAPVHRALGGVNTSQSAPMAALGGAVQGATLGFSDELTGLGTAAAGTLTGQPGSFLERYRAARDENRAGLAKAKEEHPWAYGAGEVAGGLATTPLLPGGAAAAGTKVGAKAAALAAAKAGAIGGAAQGLGTSNAELTTGDLGQARQAASDAAKGALFGGVAGGVLGFAGGKLVEKAEKNAAGWVVKDISGEVKGASTATARKQLADDAQSAAKLVMTDKELNAAIEHARHGGVDELQHAQDVIRQRLAGVGGKLDPRWAEVDKLLPDKGIKSGDLVSHLMGRIEDLRATGHTTDAAEADALQGIVNRVTGARNFGAKASNVLDEKTAADVAMLQNVRNNVARGAGFAAPAKLQQIDDQIAKLTATGKKAVQFDPNHVVSAQQIQRLWSDEAGVAYNSMGGINGTQAFTRKLDVASHLRDFRDQIFEQAAQGDPKVVGEIQSLNRDYSGLKRIATVIDQRLNRSTAEATGASLPASITGGLHKVMHAGGFTGIGAALATGHPKIAAGMAALQGGVAAKRALDRGTAALLTTAQGSDASAALARTILGLMQQGVPRATAIQMARSAGQGGAINAALPGPLQTPPPAGTTAP